MFKKSIAAISFLLSSASADLNQRFGSYLSGEQNVDSEVFEQIWTQFEEEFGEHNPNKLANEFERKNQFALTLENIIGHNSDPAKTFTQGINQFSDMTEVQFREHFRLNGSGEEQHCSATSQRQSVKKDFSLEDLPTNFDWRDHNGVSPVKNQGSCGSCWTFSTVGALEAHSLVKYGSFDSLAEQQLVDCAGAYDNHGCNGGLPSHAFEYIAAAGGISTEDSYPYFAVDHNCTVDSSTFALNVVGGSINITEGDESELLHAIFEHGPVSIAFEVVDGFKDYKTGVYTSDVCKNGSGDVNHAVLAVGFGSDEETGLDYWVVKNSWGTAWGDQGYFKILRGSNMCGVAQCNSYPNDVLKLSVEEKLFMQ